MKNKVEITLAYHRLARDRTSCGYKLNRLQSKKFFLTLEHPEQCARTGLFFVRSLFGIVPGPIEGIEGIS